jgi:ABC-2 type transport system permease protein
MVLEIVLVTLLGSLNWQSFDISGTILKFDLPNLYFNFLPVLSTFLLPVTIFMLVSDTVSLEFENNTIKNIFLRPASRFNIYLGKNLAITLYVLINLMIVYLASLVLKVAYTMSFDSVLEGFLAYAITIIPLFAFVVFCSFVACKVKSSSLTMFLLLICYLLMAFLSAYSSAIRSVLFVNYIGYYKFFIGNILPIKYILNSTLLILSNVLIFFILGYLIFDKRDV